MAMKPQLHASQLSLASRCGVKFERIVLHGEKEPPTTAMVLGTATHKVAAVNLQHKIDTAGLLPLEQIKDLARDTFNLTWDEAPILLNEDERIEGLAKVRGAGVDLSVKLSVLHHEQLAPKLSPVAVEEPWVLNCNGYPYDLAGQIDVREREVITVPDAEPTIRRRIRDLKNLKRTPPQAEVDKSEQLTVYAMAAAVREGRPPDSVHLDVQLKPTKTLGPRLITLDSTRTAEDFQTFTRRFERVVTAIEKGVFLPARPGIDWWCDRRYCGFAANGSCPYFYGRETVAVSGNGKKGAQHGDE